MEIRLGALSARGVVNPKKKSYGILWSSIGSDLLRRKVEQLPELGQPNMGSCQVRGKLENPMKTKRVANPLMMTTNTTKSNDEAMTARYDNGDEVKTLR